MPVKKIYVKQENLEYFEKLPKLLNMSLSEALAKAVVKMVLEVEEIQLKASKLFQAMRLEAGQLYERGHDLCHRETDTSTTPPTTVFGCVGCDAEFKTQDFVGFAPVNKWSLERCPRPHDGKLWGEANEYFYFGPTQPDTPPPPPPEEEEDLWAKFRLRDE